VRDEAWGTFDVGIEARMKDGSTQRLTHSLDFTPAAAAVGEYSLPQETFARIEIPGAAEPVYVYVGDIEDSWRSDPFRVHVFRPPSGWAPSGRLKESQFATKAATIPRYSRWNATMNCEGAALEFNVDSRRYLLNVERVNAAPAQDDWLKLTVSPK
jgi:hypothetical protein